jgi:hypothetical protein
MNGAENLLSGTIDTHELGEVRRLGVRNRLFVLVRGAFCSGAE